MTGEVPPLDDEIDINLRSPQEIGERIIILAALTRRLLIDQANADAESANDLFDLRHWLTEQQLKNSLTAQERRVIDAAPGEIPPADLADAEMASEALVTLAWTAGLERELPPVDEPADPRKLLNQLPSPWDSVQSFFDGLTLRPEGEIAMEWERAELWLWRAAIEPERRDAKGRSLTEIETIIKDTARESLQAGLIDNIRAGDFTLNGQPFGHLSAEQHDLVATIAAARLHALNWTCGFGTTWEETPLDV